MPITLNCPCGKTLRVADEHAGKRVKCPICHAVIEPPEPEPVFEVVDEPATRPVAAPPAAKPRADDEDEDEGGSYAMEAAEKMPDRPEPVFRSRADEDDEDDKQPRRRSGAYEGASAGKRVAYISGGVLAIIGGIVLAVIGNNGEGRGATKLLIFGILLAIGGLVSLIQGITGNISEEE